MNAELLLSDTGRNELGPAPYQAVLNRCVQRAELERIAAEAEQAQAERDNQDAELHT